VEQYLKTILSLSEIGKSVKTTEIARAMRLAPATITEGLQKLSDEGFIKYEPYHGASLTSKGKSVAKKISRKHRLLERFLSDTLGLESSQVHRQACEMEHRLSDEAEVALCRMLKHPETCPDDNKSIPPCQLDVESCAECKALEVADIRNRGEQKDLKQLTDLIRGEKARIQFIRGGKAVVNKLHSMGLTKGAEIQMMNAAPFSGPIEVCARGCKLVIGRGVARKIFVTKSR